MYMIEVPAGEGRWEPIALDTPDGRQYHFDNVATAFSLAEHSPKCDKFRIVEITIVVMHPVPPEWINMDPLRRSF